MNSKTNRSDGSKASVVRFAMLCRPKEPLSEPRRGEFRRRAANRRANRTGNATRVRRLFSNHHGVIYFIKSFLWRSFSHLHKPPPQLFIWLSEELYTSLSWSIFHSSHFSLFSGKPSRDSTRFFGSVSLLQSLFFTNLFSLLPIFYSGNGKSHTRRHFLLFSSQGLPCRIFYKKSSLRLLFAGAVGFAAGFGVSVLPD